MEKLNLYLPLILFAVILLLVNPWGNFPLNDDWIYAHVAHTFAVTGKLRFDPGFAPSLVGQVLLAAPLLKVFGFSHTLLRALSIIVGALTLQGLSHILTKLKGPPRQRILVLFCLAANPLFLYFSTTYLTEIYASCVLVWASAFWYGTRAKPGNSERPLGYGATFLCGLLFGIAFWFRQFFALGFPAWMAAYVFASLFFGRFYALRQSLKPMALGTMVYGGAVWAFFAWARASGNYAGEFSGPLRGVLHFHGRSTSLQLAILVPYLTLFTLPLLLVYCGAAVKNTGKTLAWACLFAFLAFAVWQNWTLHHLETWVHPQLFLEAYYNHRFPHYGNVVQNFGIGPITLTDAYFARDRIPARISEFAWEIIFFVAYLCQFGWFLIGGKLVAKVARTPKEQIDPMALELGLFGAIFAVLTWALTVQAFKFEVYDRYIFPVFFGTLLAWAAAGKASSGGKWERPALAAAGLFLFLEATFSLAGLHDHFQWQEARWKLFQRALTPVYGLEVPGKNVAAQIDGGYELNGWSAYEPVGKPLVPCSAPQYWSYCHNAEYSIRFLPGHCPTKIITEPVSLYLIDVGELYLCKNI